MLGYMAVESQMKMAIIMNGLCLSPTAYFGKTLLQLDLRSTMMVIIRQFPSLPIAIFKEAILASVILI
jgi:hypothetical protein